MVAGSIGVVTACLIPPVMTDMYVTPAVRVVCVARGGVLEHTIWVVTRPLVDEVLAHNGAGFSFSVLGVLEVAILTLVTAAFVIPISANLLCVSSICV